MRTQRGRLNTESRLHQSTTCLVSIRCGLAAVLLSVLAHGNFKGAEMERNGGKSITKGGFLVAALALALAVASIAQTAVAQTAQSPRSLAQRTVLVSVPDRRLAVIED